MRGLFAAALAIALLAGAPAWAQEAARPAHPIPPLKTYAHAPPPMPNRHPTEAKRLAGAGEVASGMGAPPMAKSTTRSGAAMAGMGASPAAAAENTFSTRSSGTMAGRGAPPAAAENAVISSGPVMQGMGAPPAAVSGSPAIHYSNPTNFYNR
jgi:hypothetical protein